MSAFDRPQFSFNPDPNGLRQYANVSNRLEVTTRRGRTFAVAIAVPTELFTMMRGIFNIAPEDSVSLALDLEEEDDKYLFSMLVESATKDDALIELWHQSEQSLPYWMFNREYHCA